ncbi:uncharacterized protein NKAPD1 [Pelobates fuscus]|uniref:uncharacterized protein NKAPD1 n=1 Tax=Pelobates fuscus TaxID=191477 RepID=UPI002FE4D9E9
MSRVPLGKVLLRNVIRHTDAHNKIQEESEMWKIREMEKQAQDDYGTKRRRTSPEPNRWDHNGYKELYPEEFDNDKSRMRSDGFDADGSKQAEKTGAASAVMLRQGALSIRALNKKFYECEASLPDRWGHSGYKELYPEEFDSNSDTEEKSNKRKTNGQETTRGRVKKEQESHKRKRSKKTHKKKQKKRSHKKLKKRKKELEVPTETSSESDSSEDSMEKPKKSKRKKKTRKKATRKQPSSSGQDSDSSDEMSSTEDVETEEHKGRRHKKTSQKHHHRSKPKKDTEMELRKSRRTNWKVAKDEGSDSSDED